MIDEERLFKLESMHASEPACDYQCPVDYQLIRLDSISHVTPV